MTKIIAFSGKKCSGKNTSANFLVGSAMVSTGLMEYAYIDPKGRLVIPYEKEDGTTAPCIFPVDSYNSDIMDYLAQNVWPHVKLYSFADILKSIAIEVLGLSHDQCYGSDDDKNTLTSLLWENMPGVITRKPIDFAWSLTEGYTEEKNFVFQIEGVLGPYYKKVKELIYHAPGPMSAREVLQFMGTDIFRKMHGNVWVDATIRRINAEGSALAVICDCRFPNEVEGTQAAGGKVIRFTRNPNGETDQHLSETVLDIDKFDWSKFDAVIDNGGMTIGEQNEVVYNLLCEWDFIDYERIAGELPQPEESKE